MRLELVMGGECGALSLVIHKPPPQWTFGFTRVTWKRIGLGYGPEWMTDEWTDRHESIYGFHEAIFFPYEDGYAHYFCSIACSGLVLRQIPRGHF